MNSKLSIMIFPCYSQLCIALFGLESKFWLNYHKKGYLCLKAIGHNLWNYAVSSQIQSHLSLNPKTWCFSALCMYWKGSPTSLVMAVMVSRPRQECRQRVIKMMLVINNVLLLLLRERGGDTSHLLQFQAASGRDVGISRHQVVTGQLSSGTQLDCSWLQEMYCLLLPVI